MTHSELLSGVSTRGFETPDCPGELVGVEEVEDPSPLDGRMHRVILARCELCGRLLSVDQTSRRLLNQYELPALLIRSLADTFQIPAGAVPVMPDRSN